MVAPNEMPEDAVADGLDAVSADGRPNRRGLGIWGILLTLVIVFGYLTAERRIALGRLAEQIADIIQDFRGYDPEF